MSNLIIQLISTTCKILLTHIIYSPNKLILKLGDGKKQKKLLTYNLCNKAVIKKL